MFQDALDKCARLALEERLCFEPLEEDMPDTHYLLATCGPPSDNIQLTMWALEAMVQKSRLHGYPMTRPQAELWLGDKVKLYRHLNTELRRIFDFDDTGD